MTLFKCTHCDHTASYPHIPGSTALKCHVCDGAMLAHVTPPSVSYKCVEVSTSIYNMTPVGAGYAGGVVVEGTSDQERDKLLLILRVED